MGTYNKSSNAILPPGVDGPSFGALDVELVAIRLDKSHSGEQYQVWLLLLWHFLLRCFPAVER